MRDSQVVADPERDLAKIAVTVEPAARPAASASASCAARAAPSAVATTMAHDAHNIIAVGVSDDDIARCVERLAELGGAS